MLAGVPRAILRSTARQAARLLAVTPEDETSESRADRLGLRASGTRSHRATPRKAAVIGIPTRIIHSGVPLLLAARQAVQSVSRKNCETSYRTNETIEGLNG